MPDAKTLRARADKAANALPASPEPQADGSIAMEAMTVTIASTNRPIQLVFPVDMSEGELLEVMGWMGTALRNHLAQRRMHTAGGRILIPGRH